MKAFFASIRKTLIAGFLFFLPVFVILVIVTKAWGMLTGVGQKVAGLFGLKTIAGIGTTSIITGLILLLILFLGGLLVRLAFIGNFRIMLEEKILVYIPGYTHYKNIIREKIDKKAATPKTPVLVKMLGHLQPALLVENDEKGNSIIIVPASPSITNGQVFLVKSHDIIELNISEQTLKSSLQSMGKGLLDLQEQINNGNPD